MVTEFNTGEVDGRGGRLISYDGREVPFDLAVLVPLDGGQANVDCSPGLRDELGFVPTDRHTLQSNAKPNVFVVGDAADVPASKAGSVAHVERETLARNICRYLAGEPYPSSFPKARSRTGGLPGVASVMTHYMTHKMDQLDIPSIPEFIEMIADTGAGLYDCKASVDPG